MNIYCHKCDSEMEVMSDLGTVLKVYPCGCCNKENSVAFVFDNEADKVEFFARLGRSKDIDATLYGYGESLVTAKEVFVKVDEVEDDRQKLR